MTRGKKGILRTLGAFVPLTASLLWAAPDVVARIGELTISVEDYERRARQLRRTGYGHVEEWDQASKEEVLEGIIARELLILEGLRRGLHRDSTIAAAVSREEQKALMNRLYDAEALRGTYTSSDEELRAFFLERRYDTEVYSRHIVCRTEDQARQVLAALDDGIPFEALVPRYSQRSIQDRFGPGGWVGWFKVGELLEELREPLSTMAEGRFHPEPVKTSLGYHVFGLRERRAVDFEAAREFVAEQLRVQKRADDMERYVVELRRRYRLEPDLRAFPALRSVPEGEEVFPGPDQVLFRWQGGELTIQDYMASLRAGRAKHPARIDSAGLYKAADNVAGRRIMWAEARRLGLDQNEEVRRRVESRRAELMAKALYRSVTARTAAVGEEEARAFYERNLDLFRRKDGQVTEFERLQDSIRTLLRNQAENEAMDALLAQLRQRYEDRIETYPEALRLAFPEERPGTVPGSGRR